MPVLASVCTALGPFASPARARVCMCVAAGGGGVGSVWTRSPQQLCGGGPFGVNWSGGCGWFGIQARKSRLHFPHWHWFRIDFGGKVGVKQICQNFVSNHPFQQFQMTPECFWWARPFGPNKSVGGGGLWETGSKAPRPRSCNGLCVCVRDDVGGGDGRRGVAPYCLVVLGRVRCGVGVFVGRRGRGG